MRKLSILVSVVCILGALLLSVSWAQQGKGPGGGWGAGNGRTYNPQTVETLTGEVMTIESFPGRGGGRSYGVHMTLKTDKETISVHLGPGWYIEKQDIRIVPKDQVEIIGSRVSYQGKPTVIAAEVKKGDKVLKLRDQAGIPL